MFDLFSAQFEFFINSKRKGRQTLYGRAFTVLIFLTSLIFFITLIIRLNNNTIIPKIIEITNIDNNVNQYTFDRSPLSFSLQLQDKMADLDSFSEYVQLQVAATDRSTGQSKFLELENC